MNANWLIDADMFDRYRDRLVAAIRERGDAVKLIHAPNPPFRWDDSGCSYRETFPAESCVVALGDIELVTRIHRERRWTPGAFCTVENYFWSKYACSFGRFLLNHNYVMLPFGELGRCRDFLFSIVGRDDRIFIRPDSPLKLFAGHVASRATFDADLEFMGFYEFPVESMVVVSAPRDIAKEWRFVIAEGKVVAGSLYKDGPRFDTRPNEDVEAQHVAQRIAKEPYQPDPVWVIDICQTTDQEYHLLEIGGFSFADLYACNMKDVVAAVSTVAERVWQDTRQPGSRSDMRS